MFSAGSKPVQIACAGLAAVLLTCVPNIGTAALDNEENAADASTNKPDTASILDEYDFVVEVVDWTQAGDGKIYVVYQVVSVSKSTGKRNIVSSESVEISAEDFSAAMRSKNSN